MTPWCSGVSAIGHSEAHEFSPLLWVLAVAGKS